MIDYSELYNDMKPKNKISLALRQNHYVIGQMTLMDITILTAVFIGTGAALTKGTSLAPAAVLAITTGLCAAIEFVRVKTRKAKMLQYTMEKAEQAERLMQLYLKEVEAHGDSEDRAKAQELAEKMSQMKEMLADSINPDN